MARVTQVGTILLGDDGTLDTVVYCVECGREYRGTHDGAGPSGDEAEDSYDTYVEEFLTSVSEEHECEQEE